MRYFCFCLLFLLASYSHANQFTPIHDYGDRQAPALWESLQQLEKNSSAQAIRIIQLGDSHTAGDYFTGQLRQRLQRQFGNAGIGWLTPGYVTNQRSHQVLLRSLGKWTLSDSKIAKHTGVYPLGGLINTSAGNSILELKIKDPVAAGQWQLSIWQQSKQTPWSLALAGGKVSKLPGQGDVKSLNNSSTWQLSTQLIDASKLDRLRLLAPSGGKLGEWYWIARRRA